MLEFGNAYGRGVSLLIHGTKFFVLLVFSAPTGASAATLPLLL